MDNFYLEKVFPEAEKIFGFVFEGIDKICEDCLFVFDTNILLVPFLVSNKGFKDYKKICQKLNRSKRLYIPARVAREFAKNRGENIKAIFRKLHEAKERVGKNAFDLDPMPVLEEELAYKKLKEIEQSVAKIRKEYMENIDSLIDTIKKWNWDDPVSQFYKELWSGENIFEMNLSEEELLKTFKFRIEHQIAPGFKDKNKIDEGIGDLIIWQTIMEISQNKNKDVVFVTSDEKNDWFYREKNTALYPKFELFDEFRRNTKGHSISIINFEQFLITQKAKEETIKEIKELWTPSGFLKIDKQELVKELKVALKIAQERNGFVGSKFFVETILAEQLFDIGTSWETINELVREGIIEIYHHIDEQGNYPPISALRLV